ncbi:nuclear distribution protein nudE-like 1 isoform X1 [Serinus canaria]|uniref:nuclear distribution protein nudE-like 1 isoform X1 n=1 Tax=Serinus canaria TaxID=9135 RepID=UPI0021CD1203|nr:nuclear distribution protein nudE-like 1 isoform X1 [Serinus canaria]XP_050837374.1 nuclear distribution protein nudE-like 1 isoform X1 [Serinus canaria]XP_050837375.1 nuclear distribution protein nudE-like 1 isoform X1 [Serinus canaria]XP_050837376.1 nuclear distribution protein nudE-like 1 isoform X1 [Serinus canaria]XP_050837377.1 nuclear distribution protein nudE-like 1 isoform X1 [Serinus canaria]XP_050837378.1 nuclear distribution protein nudE-like 1 isoform X1 [Serinus canaria]XP_05
MWNPWILQNQWPWLLLCPAGFSAETWGGGQCSGSATISHSPSLGNGARFGHRGTAGAIPASAAGTEGGTRYFNWGRVGSLQLSLPGDFCFLRAAGRSFLCTGAGLGPFPGCSIPSKAAPSLPGLLHPFPGCSIPSRAAPSLPRLLHPLPGCSIPSRAAPSLPGLLHPFPGCSIPSRAAPSLPGLLHPFQGCSIPSRAAPSLPGLLHPFPGCSIPSVPGAVPVPLLPLSGRARLCPGSRSPSPGPCPCPAPVLGALAPHGHPGQSIPFLWSSCQSLTAPPQWGHPPTGHLLSLLPSNLSHSGPRPSQKLPPGLQLLQLPGLSCPALGQAVHPNTPKYGM